MKKIFAVIFVLFLGLFSCKKVLDKLLTFTFNDSVDITIPASTLVNTPFTLATPEVTSNASAEFSENGTSKDKIKSVRLSEMTMTITSPNNQTFNFLNSIEIYISADGLDDVLIAQKSNIGNNDLTILELDVTNADFAEHIKKDTYRLDITVKTDETLSQKVEITSDLKFKVTANAFN